MVVPLPTSQIGGRGVERRKTLGKEGFSNPCSIPLFEKDFLSFRCTRNVEFIDKLPTFQQLFCIILEFRTKG
jgi:hypothetical protein